MFRFLLILALLQVTGCASGLAHRLSPNADAGRVHTETGSRQMIRRASIQVEVDNVAETGTVVRDIVSGSSGYVESSSCRETRALFTLRIPQHHVDGVLDGLAELGVELSRHTSSEDVTDAVADLDAAIRNKVALRDRLRLLLERAVEISDVLRLEQELARLQTDIDRMQGRLDRLGDEVAMSTVEVNLSRGRILGPIGYVFHGLAWVGYKLLVIQE